MWAWDFVFDRTANGRAIKWLSIVDEYTRECVALEVNRGLTSDDVLDVLRDLFVIRGVPSHIRSDNGPEFIAPAIRPVPVARRGGGDAVHRAGFAVAERLCGELPQPATERAARRGGLRERAEAQCWRELATRLQPPPTAQCLDYQTPAAFAAGCVPLRLRLSLQNTADLLTPILSQPLP